MLISVGCSVVFTPVGQVKQREVVQFTVRAVRLLNTRKALLGQQRGFCNVVRIGGVSASRNIPKRPDLVPRHHLVEYQSNQWFLGHLKFMLQKHILGQDVFLIGPPSPLKRSLALSFCELMDLECETVVLSRDITESDLKQRREIVSGELKFVDMPPLSCALNGRILLLDGVEKAERNVLPALNNLLENREMSLLDGRKLVSSTFFDKTVKDLGITPKVARDELGLTRAHENFRVIALGVPVPTYPGFPLDPPLRSRFQGRYIDAPSNLTKATTSSPTSPELLTLIDSLRAIAGSSGTSANRKFHHLPENTYERMLHSRRDSTTQEAFAMCFPSHHVLRNNEDQQKLLNELLQQTLGGQKAASESSQHQHTFPKDFHPTQNITALLNQMENEARHMNLCLVGPGGSGKSKVAHIFAGALKERNITTVFCYKDMSSRDLLQKRVTDAKGNTTWIRSPIVDAAVNGDLVILDGVHRLEPDTIASIQQLLHHGDLPLPNGDRLLRHDRYDFLGEKGWLTDDILRVDEEFRVLALAQPPVSKEKDWLTPEVLSMFSMLEIPKHTYEDVLQIISKSCTGVTPSTEFVDRILADITACRVSLEFLDNSNKIEKDFSLSLRQCIRIVKTMASQEGVDLYDVLRRVLLIPFRSQTLREGFEEQVRPLQSSNGLQNDHCFFETASKIRSKKAQQISSNNVELVPHVPDFVNLPHQLEYMRLIALELSFGSHCLLIGNQGTGKNKLTDRLLQELHRPREYLQLSRDSSVSSLTVTPTLESGGKLTFIDSPLVRAVKNGHVLVLDEADKASVEVVTVLKGLLIDGEMTLSDGRRICVGESGDIQLHPDFRVICLANRPGFPFLGNDFFQSLGDCFSPFIIDNGGVSSFQVLLESYPGLTARQVQSLSKSFFKLRSLQEEGVISYPYSTREAAAVARHQNQFPEDGVQALSNVFDFDYLDQDKMELIGEVFAKEGIIGVGKHYNKAPVVVNLSKETSVTLERPELESSQPKSSGRIDEQKKIVVRGRNVTFLLGAENQREGGKDGERIGRITEFNEEILRFHYSAESPKTKDAIPVSISPVADGVAVLTKQPSYVCFNRMSTSGKGISFTQICNIEKLTGTGVYVEMIPMSGSLLLASKETGLLWTLSGMHDGNIKAMRYELPEEFLGKKVQQRYIPHQVQDKLFSVSATLNSVVLRNDRDTLRIDGETNKDLVLVSDSPSATPPMRDIEVALVRDGRGLLITDFTRGTTREIELKDFRNEKRLDSKLSIVDFSYLGTEHHVNTTCAACLLSNGSVSVVEIDRDATEYSLDEWLSQFSTGDASGGTNAVTDPLTIEVSTSIDLNPTSTPIPASRAPASSSLGGPASGSASDGAVAGGPGGVGGGGGSGAKIDRSDGWGGYTSEKIDLLLSTDLEHRIEKGLPVTEDEAMVYLQQKERQRSLTESVMEAQTVRQALEDIEMSSHGVRLYLEAKEQVSRQIKQLKLVLESAQAKEEERAWLQNKTAGELDENKLVEGLVGETLIYRKRGKPDKMSGLFQEKPKRMLFVLDTSASMARANDDRLKYLLQAVVMFMESLDEFPHKFEYAIQCHSGSSPNIPVLDFGEWPNEHRRKEVVNEIVQLTRSAMTGDETLKAAQIAIDSVLEEDADDYFVVLLSDCNLGRYNVSGEEFGKVLTSNPKVNCHCVFIAEPNAAEWLSKELPLGKGHLCLHPDKLPKVLADIFDDALVDE